MNPNIISVYTVLGEKSKQNIRNLHNLFDSNIQSEVCNASLFLISSSVLRPPSTPSFYLFISNLSFPHIQSTSPKGGMSRQGKGGGIPPGG